MRQWFTIIYQGDTMKLKHAVILTAIALAAALASLGWNPLSLGW